MDCKICGSEIIGKRKGSIYCSESCINKAKQNRAVEKYLNGLDTDNSLSVSKPNSMALDSPDELRRVERENFNTVMQLRTEYSDKIRALEDINLRNEFKIEKLEDKIKDLKENHSKDLAEANKSTTKETVSAISQMPAVQTTLGMLANSFMSKKNNALGGFEDEFNIQERQIIEAIRRMQPEAQTHLVQMLYVLFAKSNEEQMQIFTSLQAYMMNSEEEVDV